MSDGGISIKVDTSQVTKLAREVAERLGEDAVLKVGVDVVSQSVLYNFAVGGRPNKWAPPKYRQGQPLRDTGILMASISGQITGGKGIVSTVDKRANTLHYGAKKGKYGTKSVTVKSHSRKRKGKTYSVKSHKRKQQLPWGNIPARPFMLYQVPEDILEIERQLKRKVEGRQ